MWGHMGMITLRLQLCLDIDTCRRSMKRLLLRDQEMHLFRAEYVPEESSYTVASGIRQPRSDGSAASFGAYPHDV